MAAHRNYAAAKFRSGERINTFSDVLKSWFSIPCSNTDSHYGQDPSAWLCQDKMQWIGFQLKFIFLHSIVPLNNPEIITLGMHIPHFVWETQNGIINIQGHILLSLQQLESLPSWTSPYTQSKEGTNLWREALSVTLHNEVENRNPCQ